MIFYNGTTGSLGGYFAEAARAAKIAATPIRSRLEDLNGFRAELGGLTGGGATFVLLAAKVSVPWCENHEAEARKTNVDDTLAAAHAFIEVCRKKSVIPRLLYVSSAHLYAKNDGAIHETDPVSPRSVYARTKFEAENALRKLAEETGTDLRIARVFGLIAPVQPDYYVLHSMLKRAREKRMADIPGLSNLRDYLDSRDVCQALLKLLELDSEKFTRVCPDRVINIASGRGLAIRELAETSLRALYPTGEAEKFIATMTEAPPRADDVPRIIASVDRFRALFGENPLSISLADTVRDALKTPKSTS